MAPQNFPIRNVVVVGLGYVGLPLASLFVAAGYTVVGIDASDTKISSLRAGSSYVSDMTDNEIQSLFASGRFTCDTSFEHVAHADCVIICVPTPVSDDGCPDLTYIVSASRSIASYLRENQLVVLESSTYPGTTDDVVVPLLDTSNLKAGTDYYVAYSPERINPGDKRDLRTIPKVVGGINEASTQAAYALYKRVFENVVVVSSAKVAELTKILENTQRLINLSLMNELVIVCEKLDLNIWEAIDAAKTKPYGFMAYYPGPGIGGHCIPVDPLYLQWKAGKNGTVSQLIAVAKEINDSMPPYVADRVIKLTTVPNPEILLIGMTYKKDVNDLRESSAVKVLHHLMRKGIRVTYHDPYIDRLDEGGIVAESLPLTPEAIRRFDCVVILTDHSAVNYAMIGQNAGLILDTRNVTALRPYHNKNVVLL